jgi:protein-tyrosine phosphatase
MKTLRKVVNFRDIGGHETHGGRRVREGVVYRSGHLAGVDAEDLATLERLGIRKVIDFRNRKDIDVDGGAKLPRGATRIHVPMGDPAEAPAELRGLLSAGDPQTLARHLGQGQAVALMHHAVRALVLHQRRGYATMLRELAHAEGTPAIIHCSAGKDRTGWGATLLLLIAGVPDAAIVDHYLESNVHRAEEIEAALARTPTGVDPEWMRPFFEVRPEYADTGLETLRAQWRDVDDYVVAGLGVEPDVLHTLRERLLEP